MEKNLQTQLLDFQKTISVIKKDAKNPHFKNTYASLTQILSEVKPVLNEVGVLITQPISEGKVGTMLSYGTDSLVSLIDLPNNLSPQQLGSAITYFRRYTLASLLALEIDDDDAQSTVKTTIQQPTLNSENAKSVLIIAKNLDDLKQRYTNLSKAEQNLKDVIELKDKLKDGFTKQSTNNA